LRRIVILAACTAIVVAGFVGTIISVSTDDIDGLNYLPNALFGLPWNLVVAPIAWLLRVQDNVSVRAVVDLIAALVNVALLGRALRRRASTVG
jgi:hypothetical protein